LCGGNGVNSLGMLAESQGTVGLVVACNFLETISTTLHREEVVHLQGVLGSGELVLINGVSEGVKSLEGNCEQISRVGSSTLHVDTEQTGISEVSVDSLETVNKTVVLHGLVCSS